MKKILFACVALVPFCGAWAQTPTDELITQMKAADVVILGEIHDNPAHHQKQAQIVDALSPRAVVYEMLSPEQAHRVDPADLGDAESLATVLDWSNSGWPDFQMYYPIFEASDQALVFGAAIPRSKVAHVSDSGIAAVFGKGAAQYGLLDPLPTAQQETREAMQMSAHCDALPETMLPMLVDFQRLRDASLARAVVAALDQTGGPVAVITGNGHARRDWGVPIYLQRLKPDAKMFVLGQVEEGASRDGVYDAILEAPAAEREDPCAQFAAKSN